MNSHILPDAVVDKIKEYGVLEEWFYGDGITDGHHEDHPNFFVNMERYVDLQYEILADLVDLFPHD